MNKYDLVKRLRKECSLTEAEKLIKAAIDTFGRGTDFPPRFRDVRARGTGRSKRT